MAVESEVMLCFFIVSFLVGLPANLLALYAFSRKIHAKPQPTDVLLLNLTVSDLLFLLVLPLKMHEAASGMTWDLPFVLCSITTFIFFSTIYTSSLLLTAVSAVRYVAVAHPVAYQRLHRPAYAVAMCAVIWLISGAQCSTAVIIMHHPSLAADNNLNGSVCYNDFNEEQGRVLLLVRLEAFIVLCLVPLLICVYCYTRCIWSLCSRPRIPRVQKQKAIGMALGTLAVFLVCVLPYNTSHVVGYFQGVSPEWRPYALLLSTFNTCIDPIIFYFSTSRFHCTFEKSIFRRLALIGSGSQRGPTSSD